MNKQSNEKFTAEEMKKYPQMLQANCVKSRELTKKLQNMNANRCDPNFKGKTQRDTINNKRLCYDDIYKEIVSKLDTESNCVMSKRVNSTESNRFDSDLLTNTNTNTKLNKNAISPIIKVSKLVSKSVSTKSLSAGSATSAKDTSTTSAKDTSTNSNRSIFRDKGNQVLKTQSQNLKPDEGPEFINQFFIPAYDSKRANAYSSYTLDVPFGVAHKYRTTGPVSTYDDISRLSDPGYLSQLAGYKKIKELDGLEYKGSKQR